MTATLARGTRAAAPAGTLTSRLRASPLARLMLVGAVSRVWVIAVAWWAGATLPWFLPEQWSRGPLFVRYLARWDSGFYMDIAQFGYGFKPEAWAFNPGYPAAIALVRAVVPVLDYPVAGVLVSHAAFFAALALFYALTRELFDPAMAWRAGVVLAVFPGSFYMSTVYADALFLALLLGFFLALNRERWILAGATASLAAVTRPPGIVLLGVLGLGALLALWRDRRIPWRALPAFPVALTLPAVFAVYAWHRTGDPFISARIREVYWPNVQWHNPLTILDFSGAHPLVTVHVYVGLGVLVASCAWMVWDAVARRRLAALPVYAFTTVMAVVYLAYSEPNPIVRYLLPILPVYWMIADVARGRAALAIVALVLAMLAGVVAAVFATWGALY